VFLSKEGDCKRSPFLLSTYLYGMEFNIRKNSTLPILEVSVIKNGRTDYNYSPEVLSGSTIYFYMKNIDDQTYKVAKGNALYSIDDNSFYYQFTKRNTSTIGRYIGEFKILNDQGLLEIPLNDKLYINILDSFSNSEFCCK